MIDTHAHLNFAKFSQDYAEVIQRSFNNGIKKIINVGSNLATSQRAIDIAHKFKNCYAALGLHPIHVMDEKFEIEKYRSLIRANERIIKAIGETGLDYFRIMPAPHRNHSGAGNNESLKDPPAGGPTGQVRIKQKEVFLKHLELAQKFNLPVILHCRGSKENSKDAYLELLKMLQVTSYKLQGVLHCFSADWQIAKQFLNLGFYIGLTGVITFSDFSSAKSGDEKSRTRRSPTEGERKRVTSELLEAVKKIPLDKILIETDCPFLAPQPVRGQRCEPWHVKFTAEKIAEIKEKQFEEIIRATTDNAIRLFNL